MWDERYCFKRCGCSRELDPVVCKHFETQMSVNMCNCIAEFVGGRLGVLMQDTIARCIIGETFTRVKFHFAISCVNITVRQSIVLLIGAAILMHDTCYTSEQLHKVHCICVCVILHILKKSSVGSFHVSGNKYEANQIV